MLSLNGNLQISDIHVSKFKDEGRVKDFREFCTKTVDIIKPPIILGKFSLGSYVLTIIL